MKLRGRCLRLQTGLEVLLLLGKEKEIVHALGQTARLSFAAVIADGAILQQVVSPAGAISCKRQGTGRKSYIGLLRHPQGIAHPAENEEMNSSAIRYLHAVSSNSPSLFSFLSSSCVVSYSKAIPSSHHSGKNGICHGQDGRHDDGPWPV